MILLNGRLIRDTILPGLIARFEALPYKPVLAIIQAGDRPDSTAFIAAKKNFAAKLGVEVKHMAVSADISQKELMAIVHECNADNSIHGIIVQLPLPIAIDTDAIIDAIDARKDVDGLTATQVKRWLSGREDAVMSATARGIRTLLKQNSIELFGKKVTVVGRSLLVGKPIIAMCLNENATVTVCHSKTADLASETKRADILIVAAGKPGLITPSHVSPGQIVVDVGISRGADNTLVGDVDFEAVKDSVAAISPVPGGVGPMTVCSLFENLADLCEQWRVQ